MARATRSRAPTAVSSGAAVRRRSRLRSICSSGQHPVVAHRGPARRWRVARDELRPAGAGRRSRSRRRRIRSSVHACARVGQAGGYRAVSPDGVYRGAYQFLRSTWNNVARAGRPSRPRRCRPGRGVAGRSGPARAVPVPPRRPRAVGRSLPRACSNGSRRSSRGRARPGAPEEGSPSRRPYRLRMVDGPLSPDLAIGSFTDHGPWVVEPEEMTWRRDVDRLPRAGAGRVPALDGDRPSAPARPAASGSSAGSAARSASGRSAPGARARRTRAATSPAGCASPSGTSARPTSSSARSSRGGEGLFPEELVAEFKLLRDRVPPESFDDVRRVVELELGRSLDDVFASFERTPIAAASIAQVHAARLRTGEDVVVKVQRPQIARLVREDIEAMSWLAPHLIGRIPVAALANPPALDRAVRGDDRRGARLPPRSARTCSTSRACSRRPSSAPRSCPARIPRW